MRMSENDYARLKHTIHNRFQAGTALWVTAQTSERVRWDCLFMCGYDVNSLYKSGLNDAHIDTALRTIFRN